METVRLTVGHLPSSAVNGYPVATAGTGALPAGTLGLLEVHDDGFWSPSEFLRPERVGRRTKQ